MTRTVLFIAATRVGIYLLLLGIVLFASAGTLRWAGAWAYLAITAAASFYGLRTLPSELLEERMSGLRAKPGTQRWDIPFVLIIAMVGPLALALVAGFDRRLGWSSTFPPAVSAGAGAGIIAAFALVERAMRANKFFSSVVRLQTDRGQTVITSGPYARVRHPGYAGGILQTVCLPPLLGSRWAFLPAGVMVVAFIIRTALEDRLLRRSLPGYAAYAGSVTWRLVPGLW